MDKVRFEKLKPAKYEIQKRFVARFDRCFAFFTLRDQLDSQQKQATKPKFVAQSRPALYYLQQQQMFAGSIDENLQRNNVARQVKGFCITYFAAFN